MQECLFIFTDDESSTVTSHFTDDGLWCASIKTAVDHYFVEVGRTSFRRYERIYLTNAKS